MTMENTKQLSMWSLCLPACRISESVQQLMELALNTLCEAVGSSTQWYVTVPKTLLSSKLTSVKSAWLHDLRVTFCFSKQKKDLYYYLMREVSNLKITDLFHSFKWDSLASQSVSASGKIKKLYPSAWHCWIFSASVITYCILINLSSFQCAAALLYSEKHFSVVPWCCTHISQVRMFQSH